MTTGDVGTLGESWAMPKCPFLTVATITVNSGRLRSTMIEMLPQHTPASQVKAVEALANSHFPLVFTHL